VGGRQKNRNNGKWLVFWARLADLKNLPGEGLVSRSKHGETDARDRFELGQNTNLSKVKKSKHDGVS